MSTPVTCMNIVVETHTLTKMQTTPIHPPARNNDCRFAEAVPEMCALSSAQSMPTISESGRWIHVPTATRPNGPTHSNPRLTWIASVSATSAYVNNLMPPRCSTTSIVTPTNR